MCQGLSQLLILGMVIAPLMTGILISWVYLPRYYWDYDPPLFYGNGGSVDPSTYKIIPLGRPHVPCVLGILCLTQKEKHQVELSQMFVQVVVSFFVVTL